MGFLNRFREIPHADIEIEHISEHLTQLFSTYRGNGGTFHIFGIGQPETHANAAGASLQLLTEIFNDVMHLERRIERPVLQLLPGREDLCRKIRLTGYVRGRKVHFDILHNPIYGGATVEEVVFD